MRKKIKNINLRIYPDRRIYISAPLNLHTDYIENFIRSKKGWIDEVQKRLDELPKSTELQYVTGCWIDWCPPQKFYKQHLSDHPARPATATRPATEAIKAGSLVSKGGKPILYTTLRIFCQYYIDEFGEKQWIRGGSPEEVGQRAFSAYCIPAEEDKAPQLMPTTPEPEIVGGKVVQPAPAPTAQGQQPTFTQAPQGGQPLPY